MQCVKENCGSIQRRLSSENSFKMNRVLSLFMQTFFIFSFITSFSQFVSVVLDETFTHFILQKSRIAFLYNAAMSFLRVIYPKDKQKGVIKGISLSLGVSLQYEAMPGQQHHDYSKTRTENPYCENKRSACNT